MASGNIKHLHRNGIIRDVYYYAVVATFKHARLAQSVEHETLNLRCGGFDPASSGVNSHGLHGSVVQAHPWLLTVSPSGS